MLTRQDHARALRLIRAVAAGGATPATALPHILRICDEALGGLDQQPAAARREARLVSAARRVERDFEVHCHG